MNHEVTYGQTGFRKGTRDQIASIHRIIEKATKFQKTSTSASLTTLKLLTVWITTNCGKFLKRWEYQTTLPASWETCMQVMKQQSELDVEQHSRSSNGLVAQSCLTLCDPTDCSLTSSSVHGILQARIPFPFPRGSSWPRDWTQVSCITDRFFTIWATGKTLWNNRLVPNWESSTLKLYIVTLLI